MHKQFALIGVLFFAALGICLSLTSNKSQASITADLLNSSQLDIIKTADVPSLPTTLNGNTDCLGDGPYDCVVNTSYGRFSNGYLKRNRTSNYYQLISFVDNKPHSIAIPNSDTIINYTTEPPYGFYLYFTKNLAASLVTKENFGTLQYQINRAYDAKLVDKAGHRLAADYTSMSFSVNSKWLVVSMPNVAMLRVNLETFEVLPFAAGSNYTIGLDPAVKTAITNDGRYAIIASKMSSRWEIYDLDSCAAAPNTINGPVACQSRSLQTVMRQKFPDFISVAQVRFINNHAVKVFAEYNAAGGKRFAPFVISLPGAGLHQHDYLALGDSYISGEGAYSYLAGTDTADNKCHVSTVAYPYLLSSELSYNSFHSVACSGAHTYDINDSSDSYVSQAFPKTKKQAFYQSGRAADILANFQSGYINQLEFVNNYQPQVITVSIGGNDAGFTDILTSCVSPLNSDSCYSSYEDRLELVRQINRQFPNLVETFQNLKNAVPPDSRIYVIGYPQTIKAGGDCGFNVQLNQDETVFAEQFTSYLNSVIQKAANRVGVVYVDTEQAFEGHRLCEAAPGQAAVNGLTVGSDFPKLLGGFIHWPLANESYHPTALGYGLLEKAISAATDGLATAMPAVDQAAGPPPETNLDILSAPRSGRSVKTSIFDDSFASDMLFRGMPADIAISGPGSSLKPLTGYRVELQTNPQLLGNYNSVANGDLAFQLTVPADTPAGFHRLHIYGPNVAGEVMDIYKTVYVAASVDDYNGNGIANAADPCVFVDASGQDYDQDGIDDACDGVISEQPATLLVWPSQAEPVLVQVAVLPSFGTPFAPATTQLVPSRPADQINLLAIDSVMLGAAQAAPSITIATSPPQTTQPQIHLDHEATNYQPKPDLTPASKPTTSPKVLAAETEIRQQQASGWPRTLTLLGWSLAVVLTGLGIRAVVRRR